MRAGCKYFKTEVALNSQLATYIQQRSSSRAVSQNIVQNLVSQRHRRCPVLCPGCGEFLGQQGPIPFRIFEFQAGVQDGVMFKYVRWQSLHHLVEVHKRFRGTEAVTYHMCRHVVE